MEFSVYFNTLRRWLWLIALAAIVGASITFASTRGEIARFQTSVLMQIGRYVNLANPDPGMIVASAQLAQTYIVLMKTAPILNAVIEKLQLPVASESLAEVFSAQLIPATSFLQITVTYTDPVVAADIANELAAQLIANSPTDLSQEEQEQLDILRNEMRAVNEQLQRSRDELRLIDSSLQSQTEVDKAVLMQRRIELVEEINADQANLSSIAASLQTLQQRGIINVIRVVEPAKIPTSPIPSSSTNRVLVSAVIGALLAAGISFGIEYLNNTLRLPSEVMPLLNLPLLGAIAPFGSKRSYKNKLITWAQPRSTISEAYRALRVNILYRENNAGPAPDCRVYAVTSPGPSEGKSVTVSNLAVTFAITGMRVLVIDADLRRPTMHKLFNVANTTGLSNIWETDANGRGATVQAGITRAVRSPESLEMMSGWVQLLRPQLVQKTGIPNLELLPAGQPPPNPAELLDSIQTRELVNQLTRSGDYDAIFIDTPPTLVVTDSTIVANVTGAKMLLVVESGRTNRASAVRAAQQLTALQIPILGVIMNRLNPRDRDAGYGYYYYYGYNRYGPEPEQKIGPGSSVN